MRQIEIKDGESVSTYQMPENWGEVTIGQFIELMEYGDKFKDKETLTEEETTDRITMTMAILMDTDDITINRLSTLQWSQLAQTLEWVYTTEPEKTLPKIIEINGQEFGLEPDFQQMYKGAWIDANMFLKGGIKNLHQITAIFIREIKSKKAKYPAWYVKDGKHKQEYSTELVDYSTDGREVRAQFFKENMSVNVSYGIFVFFWVFAAEFLNSSKDSIVQMMMEQEMKLED